MGSCDVYYVTPDQVSKTAPSGEYLSKGGFTISGRKEYFRGVRLVIAVGFVVGETVDVVAGPVSAVESKTCYYAKVSPGDFKSEELAKAVRDAAAKKAGIADSERIRMVGVELIQKLIPCGRGQVSA